MNDPIITPRLTLSPVGPEDREALAALFRNEEIGKTYMVPVFGSEDEEDAFFDRFFEMSRSGKRFIYGIRLGGKLIGMINEVCAGNGEIELGYFIDPAEKNRGYASEALSGTVPVFLSSGFDTVKCGAFEENGASLRVMEKSGMKKSGETDEIEYRGKTHKCVYYAAHREEKAE